MSCHLITGLPRNGKSYYCVTRIVEDLIHTDRTVYTNLPIHPDTIAKKVAVLKYDRRNEHYLDIYDEVLRRIRIFRTFTSRKDIEEFRKKNPCWCRLHRKRRRSKDGQFQYSEKLLYPFYLLSNYWDCTKANSLFYLDECYQIWNYLDASERSAEAKDKRKDLQNYMRMHGHDGDDIFLITHKERDLDKFILDTLSYRIEVRNAKYWPIVPQEVTDKYWWLAWLGSLRWPCQFFILRTFIGDEKISHRSFFKRCDKAVFKCYDSMSRPNGLKDRGLDVKNMKSSDLNKGYFSEIREWFFDAWPALLILFILAVTVYGIFQGLYLMVQPRSTGTVIGVSAFPTTSKPAGQGGAVAVDTAPRVDTPYLKVRSVSPVSVYFDNGFQLKKGGVFDYEGTVWFVDYVSAGFVVLSSSGGKKRILSTARIARF